MTDRRFQLVPKLITVLLFSLASCTPTYGQAESSPEAVRQYRLAFGYQKRQLYPQAIERWTAFLAKHGTDPLAPNAAFNLGISQFRAEKLTDAAATFRQVLQKYPKFEQRDAARFNLGLVLYNEAIASEKGDDFRNAAKVFAEITGGKQAADAAYYRAECLAAAGDSKAAIEAHRKLLAGHADASVAPNATYALGTLLQDGGEHESAAKTFEEFLAQYSGSPNSSECRLRLAMSQVQLEKFDIAEKHFEELAKQPDFPYADYALFQQADCCYEREDYGKAAELFESLPKRFGESAYATTALVAAGRSRFQAKQYPQARSVLEKLIGSKADESGEAAYWLVQTHLAENKADQAVQLADRETANAKDGDWRARLAFLRIEAAERVEGDPAKAAEAFAEFAKQNADHPLAPTAAHRSAARALDAEQFATAAARADEFLQKWPEHGLAASALFVAAEGRLLDESVENGTAAELYRRFVTEHPDDERRPVAEVRVALCLFEAGKHDEAATAAAGAAGRLKSKSLVAEARLIEGRARVAQEKHEEAVRALDAAWKANEQWERGDEVLFELAESFRAAENAGEAEKRFQLLVDRFRESPWRDHALFALGDLRSARDDHDGAGNTFERLVREHDDSGLVPAALYNAAIAWYAKKDDGRTKAALDRLLKDHTDSDVAPDARLLRGRNHERAGRHTEAVTDLEAYLAANPKPEGEAAARARLALAGVYAALKKHDQAVMTLEMLIAEQPDHPRADRIRYDLAFAQRDAGRPDDAVKTYRTLVEKHPESTLVAEAWLRIGTHEEAADNGEAAAKAFAAGLAKAKRTEVRERLLYKVAWSDYEAGRHEQAAARFAELVEKFGNGAFAKESYFLLGETHRALDEHDKALPWYVRAVDQGAERHRASALYRAGDSAAALDKWDDSRRYYERLLKEFPKHDRIGDARYGIGLSHQKQGRRDEARRTYTEVAEKSEGEAAAKSRFMLGTLDFGEKKYEPAIEHFLDVALGDPYPYWQALGHLEAGRCFLELKQPEKARAEFETLIEKYPDAPVAKDAKALLERT